MTSPSPTLPIEEVRSRFPALHRREEGRVVAYLDGPGGTQMPRIVIEAMASVLEKGISNLGGGYGPSIAADEVTASGRRAMADFLNADPGEIVFGQNMTSLTFALSRALAGTWNAGDAIIVTSLDHDANYTPWVRAAGEHGVEVRLAEFDSTTGVLDPETVIDLLDDRVRLVAVCLASNSLGTLVDIAPISAAAHEAGAVVFVDAVHASPHRSIDVERLGCDFIAVSGYKFFGPHIGVLYGRIDHLAALDAYKVRPAPSDPPGKWETGTQSFEAIAAVTAAVDYIAELGGSGDTRRASLLRAYENISAYETGLSRQFLAGIDELSKVRLYGVPEAGDRRVSTFAIGIDGYHPDDAARRLLANGLYVWSGHYYAVKAMAELGVLDEGGLVRIGLVHYNTSQEVDRVLETLAEL
ncbi:MAG: cysteine desulfurase-like protein [Actinobacteria bacterium]|nr:cysteine desulfurase-like protein [Actinomycetota bacterium]